MNKCPGCDVELVKRVHGNVDLDECPQCGGIWFEREDLEQAKNASDEDLNWLDFEVWRRGDSIASSDRDTACPSCGAPTVALVCGDTGVAVDYCEACEGAWLEKGDFAQIVDALENEVNSRSFPAFVRATLREAKEVLSGDESLASEWKDFATVVRLMQYRLFVEHPELVKALMSIHRAAH